ncbi:MAG TPA: hypothetical protein VJ927_07325 [Actinomycetota bacterium]|nr:hypothetical protein [Actinomycetota bacterium]
MSKRSFVRFGLALMVAILVLPACGSDDEPPAAREFEGDEGRSPAAPPKEVQTRLQMKYAAGAFAVTLEADEDYCVDGRTVTIVQDLKKDKKIGSAETAETGAGSLKHKKVAGKYFAQVPSEPSAEYGNLSVCKGARSQTVIVKN